MTTFAVRVRRSLVAIGVGALVVVSGAPLARSNSTEKEERSRIAAANLEDAIVVDCQLPGKLQKLGGTRTYLTPGRLVRLSAVDCRARGGEYTIGDLASGTLSIQRWMPLAEAGEAEAQYYVARIYANGMGGIEIDHARAADWYQRAARQNYSAAVQELGYLYEQGLGVQKDPVLALNLQRQAAGLGEELDYAWKITAAEEEAARQVAALSQQLDASNAQLETLRARLGDTTNEVFQVRRRLARSESAALDLREQLAAAKQSASGQGDAARVAALQSALTAKEGELNAARQKMGALTARLDAQQTELSTRLAQSQASSLELNELLTGERAKSQALTARLAQAEQRLLRSQQELSGVRTQYRTEVEQLVAEREEVEQAAAKTKDQAAALLTARERDLERQRLRAASLERALAEAKRTQAAEPKPSPADSLQASVASLRARLDEQQKQVEQRELEIESLRKRAKEDRVALMREFDAQLEKRTKALEDKLRRASALSSETETLRSEVQRLSQQRDQDIGGLADEATRARASLRMAQQKLSEQRERLDQLQMEKATQMAALAKARDDLQRQLTTNRQASEMQLGFLRKDLEARQQDMKSKDEQIASLGQRLQEQSKRFDALVAQTIAGGNPVLASAQASPSQGIGKMRSADSRPTALQHSLGELRNDSSGTYHALVIGNSLYHYMESLDTPANDAKVIAQLLRERYGFNVQLLLDATREQIMMALHEAKRTLTPQDNLLIYYAGHGDVDTTSGRAFWLGVEADRDTRSGWLEADHIRAKIKEMSAKHVLLVADSCFSGAITHPKTTTIGRGLNETRLRVQWNRRARMVLTSGEITPVADSAGDATHSVFARYFIQILRQNDNVMSGEMLSHELAGRMLAQPIQVGQNGQRQRPTYSTLQDANHDIGDFFFVPVVEPVKVAALGY
ncbi:MAG: caspase family protein [Pseudomonadota bacterium]|nr:caspase family protein [Pseudomonadota bacterium]